MDVKTNAPELLEKAMLQRHYPGLIAEYGRILFEQRYRAEYTEKLRDTLRRTVAEHGLEERARYCF